MLNPHSRELARELDEPVIDCAKLNGDCPELACEQFLLAGE